MSRVIMAVADYPDETGLVAAVQGRGLVIVRRCVDAADLLASAVAEPEAAIVLTAGLPRLTAELVSGLCAGGRIVVGLAMGDAAALESLGLGGTRGSGQILEVSEGGEGSGAPELLAERLTSALVAPQGQLRGSWPEQTREQHNGPGPAGEIWAVWGPPGAPGRTTICVGLVDALAGSGRRAALVDADTTSPSVAFALGLVEPMPGLLGACRRAEHGILDRHALLDCMRHVHDWPVLAGLDDPGRWAQLRTPHMDEVWAACRAAFDVTVIDLGPSLEPAVDNPWAPERHGCPRSAASQADRIVVVADSSALGAARLAQSWPLVHEHAAHAHVTVVRNKVRSSSPRTWAKVVEGLGVKAPVFDLEDRADEVEYCWSRGRAPREQRATRRWARAMRRLSERVMRD